MVLRLSEAGSKCYLMDFSRRWSMRFLLLMGVVLARPCLQASLTQHNDDVKLSSDYRVDFTKPEDDSSNSTSSSSDHCPLEALKQAAYPAAMKKLPPCSPMLQALQEGQRDEFDGPLRLSEGCGYTWFDYKQACTVLSRHMPLVMLIGDSITRQLSMALHMLMRHNTELGGLRTHHLSPDLALNCTCDKQFTNSMCRGYTARDSIRSLPKDEPYCEGVHVSYLASMGARDLNLSSVAQVLESSPRGALVVLGGWGMHNHLEPLSLFEDLMQPMKELAQRLPHVRLLCMTLHATFKQNMRKEYWAKQSNQRVLDFNTQLRQLCGDARIPVFDAYPITNGSLAWDGVHYGLSINMLKAQLLLNVVDEWGRKAQASRALRWRWPVSDGTAVPRKLGKRKKTKKRGKTQR
mmetsp:Transcript_32768/g.72391  ORF Transcript_32768/g.72391 Transcript_32768/m.72391 type:complete len:406 (+) Transcript_32768:336-1553(+)|eukprot:CAMPEP_0202890714 /NCGR_PEP_ID=MMETSP1392-20130828/1030_1 /ASSEMBLY_ACC=CAM_ASM_000868 /TAXON_ID=225041 /ORGANISM="Chlamydomonas chlamydogama, Strain SAG 11-48b" /LENGTH=405 /DNA_ID=CAMNT_0049574333 /DNA_START=323 /DNA_END=1540 /DNA_ORIENTATION=+